MRARGQLYTTDEVEYAFDYDTRPSYGVTVRAEDGRGGSAAFGYQWVGDDAEIRDATDATYKPVVSDMGKAISVTVSFSDDAGNAETLTSEPTDAVPGTEEAQGPNSPATGAPVITGTARADETLTADTSAITDEDGLTNVSYSHQWLADRAEISGATASTYTLADADEGRAISVTVSFTDDAGHEETLQLTASLENTLSAHDGESVFTFELRFSEELSVSYRTLRDHVFTVSGGTAKNASRLERGSNVGGRIEVQPNVNGDVSIVLPATTDCADTGAICAEDGRKLSHRLELTVSGPGQ